MFSNFKLPKIKRTKKTNNNTEDNTIYKFKDYTQDDKVILLAYERRLKLLKNYREVKLGFINNKITIEYNINNTDKQVIGFDDLGSITGGKSGDQVYKVNTFVNNGINYKLEKLILKIYRKKNKKHFREIYNQIMFHDYFNKNINLTPVINHIPCPKVYLQGKSKNNIYYLLMENVRDNVYSCELEEFIINTSSTKIYNNSNNSNSNNVCIKNIENIENIENIFLQLIDIISLMILGPKIVYNHCDIHPKNVIVSYDKENEQYQVKLIDFGEARNLIKKTNKTFKACDKGRFAAMSMNKVFSTKNNNLFKKKFLGKKSFFSILSREFISLFRKDNVGRVDLRFFYMNLYLYLLLSGNLEIVTGIDDNLLKQLKNQINDFKPLILKNDLIKSLDNIRAKTQVIFEKIKPLKQYIFSSNSSKFDSVEV
jgi:hypothetical protein